jgi:hypothetical protein
MLDAIRRLFGGKGGDQETAETPAVGPTVEYKGYSIQPLAMRQASGFLTAGLISREADGKRREHRFVRADTHPSADDAREFTILKAQRLIDEQGERLFGREDGASA